MEVEACRKEQPFEIKLSRRLSGEPTDASEALSPPVDEHEEGAAVLAAPGGEEGMETDASETVVENQAGVAAPEAGEPSLIATDGREDEVGEERPGATAATETVEPVVTPLVKQVPEKTGTATKSRTRELQNIDYGCECGRFFWCPRVAWQFRTPGVIHELFL